MSENHNYYKNTDEFYIKGGNVGVLLIHGFSGSPAEMKGVGDYLSEKGFSVLGVKLSGHGTTKEDMATSSWMDWLNSAKAGYEKIKRDCEEIFIVGFSMGGLLAIEIAKESVSDRSLKGIVVLSPPMFNRDLLRYIFPFLSIFKPWYKLNNDADSLLYDSPYTFVAYEQVSLNSFCELLKLIKNVRKGGKINCPMLVLQGEKDKVIPVKSGRELIETINAPYKNLFIFNELDHQLLIGKDRNTVWEEVGSFVGDNSG